VRVRTGSGSGQEGDLVDLLAGFPPPDELWLRGGSIWTRSGPARRGRSIAVLTVLVVGPRFEELEFHLRAALTNGLARDEIVEVLLQSAVCVGVPAANTVFGVALWVLAKDWRPQALKRAGE
jgi:alkylhydroperoxidase/carboxymuconolactone decarboxylase family protein YurZ